jgi:hypothetical protein
MATRGSVSAASPEPTTIAAVNTPASALSKNFFMTAFRLGAAGALLTRSTPQR